MSDTRGLEVQRCDLCAVFPTDDDAEDHAERCHACRPRLNAWWREEMGEAYPARTPQQPELVLTAREDAVQWITRALAGLSGYHVHVTTRRGETYEGTLARADGRGWVTLHAWSDGDTTQPTGGRRTFFTRHINRLEVT